MEGGRVRMASQRAVSCCCGRSQEVEKEEEMKK